MQTPAHFRNKGKSGEIRVYAMPDHLGFTVNSFKIMVATGNIYQLLLKVKLKWEIVLHCEASYLTLEESIIVWRKLKVGDCEQLLYLNICIMEGRNLLFSLSSHASYSEASLMSIPANTYHGHTSCHSYLGGKCFSATSSSAGMGRAAPHLYWCRVCAMSSPTQGETDPLPVPRCTRESHIHTLACT